MRGPWVVPGSVRAQCRLRTLGPAAHTRASRARPRLGLGGRRSASTGCWAQPSHAQREGRSHPESSSPCGSADSGRLQGPPGRGPPLCLHPTWLASEAVAGPGYRQTSPTPPPALQEADGRKGEASKNHTHGPLSERSWMSRAFPKRSSSCTWQFCPFPSSSKHAG